ncbi:MAG: PEP-CTERM sorting domain-containing protein, partial [Roseibacillus sp.]
GGGIQTLSYTQADLVAGGIDPNASYELDFFTTDDGGWGWTRLNEVNLDAGAVGQVPEPSAFALLALGGLALLRRRR